MSPGHRPDGGHVADVLAKILARKREELAEAQRSCPLVEMRQRVDAAPAPRDFLQSLRDHAPLALIAEVKKASPSAGLIRADFDPVKIAQTYERHGAACLSVLTDQDFFQGSLRYLEQVRAAVSIPVLRKDFLIDPYQVFEARASGADAVLLIAECLSDAQLRELYDVATQLRMTSLIELYDPENLPRVLAVHPPLVGVNNRDLRSFVTDLNHTIRLRSQVPAGVLLVGESGIHTRADATRLQSAGVDAILVGESLMRQPDVGRAVDQLLGRDS